MAEDPYQPGEPHWTHGREGIVYPGNLDFARERDTTHLDPRRRRRPNLDGSIRIADLPLPVGFPAAPPRPPVISGVVHSERGIDPPTYYTLSAERSTLPENGPRHLRELAQVQLAGRRIPGLPLPVQNSGIIRNEAGEPTGEIDPSGLSLPQTVPFPVPPSTGIFTPDDIATTSPVFKRGRAKKRPPASPLSGPRASQKLSWGTQQFAAYNAAGTDEERAEAMAATTAELAETNAVTGRGPDAVEATKVADAKKKKAEAAKARREKLAGNRADKEKKAADKLAKTNAQLPEAQRVDRIPPTRASARERKGVVRFGDEPAVSAPPKLSLASAEEVAAVGSALEAVVKEAGKPAGKKRAREEGAEAEEERPKAQRLKLNGPKATTAQKNMKAESKATTSTKPAPAPAPAPKPAAKGKAKAKAKTKTKTAAAPAKQAPKRKRAVKTETVAATSAGVNLVLATGEADPTPAGKRTRAGRAASAAATATANSVPIFDTTPAHIDAAASAAVVAAAVAATSVAPSVASVPVPAPAAVAAGYFLASSTTITFPDGTTYTDPGKGNRTAPIYISGANQSRQWVKSAVPAPRNGELLEQPCTMAAAWMAKRGWYEPTFIGYDRAGEPFVKCSWCQAYCKTSKTCTSIRE